MGTYVALTRSKGLSALEATCLRTRSTQLRDVLARGASNGSYDYADLVALLGAYRHPDLRAQAARTARRLDVRWLLSTARVVGLQRLDPADTMDALTLYELAAERSPAELYQAKHARTWAQLAFVTKNYELMADVLRRADLRADIRAYLEADLINPFTGEHEVDEQRWLAVVNELLARDDLEPIQLTGDTDRPAFDRLTATPRAHVDGGPLVSVVMTAYWPDERLDVAVRSILDQSWRNLELIIVDDGTPPEHHTFLDKWEGADPRIRMIRCPENRGTYAVRNVGLDAAAGEYVTFADSDDWSHPARVQRQVEPLLADDNLVMSRSASVRTTESLEFTWLGYPPTRFNASSLLFRRKAVLDRIGYFDSVRKSADSEYHLRIKLAFPGGDVDLDTGPQAWVRMRFDTLSRNDFLPGWHAPARVAYRNAYEHWHSRILDGAASPYLPSTQTRRAFPAPRSFNPVRPHGTVDYDVVFLTDLRPTSASLRSMIEEIRALTAGGLAVAVAHVESVRHMTAKIEPFSDAIRSVINDADVDVVALDAEVRTKLVVVRNPQVLQYVPASPVRMQADNVVVVVDHYRNANHGHHYDIAQCQENLHALFHTDAVWVPHSPQARQAVASLLLPGRLADADITDVVDPAEWAVSRDQFRSHRPVIGRHARDREPAWPSRRENLTQAYPVDGSVEVRILGGAKTPLRTLRTGEPPAAWTLLEAEEVGSREFLASIDFYVYFDQPGGIDPVSRPVVEAMASGAVVILPPHYADTFGTAAICCPAEQVMEHVRRLYAEPEAYREQVSKAWEFVHAAHSHESYLGFVRALIA